MHQNVSNVKAVERRLVCRYLLLPEDPAEAPVLHREPDHPLRRHLLLVDPRVLPARAVRREDGPGHRHPGVADPVLHSGDRGEHAGRQLGLTNVSSPHNELVARLDQSSR